MFDVTEVLKATKIRNRNSTLFSLFWHPRRLFWPHYGEYRFSANESCVSNLPIDTQITCTTKNHQNILTQYLHVNKIKINEIHRINQTSTSEDQIMSVEVVLFACLQIILSSTLKRQHTCAVQRGIFERVFAYRILFTTQFHERPADGTESSSNPQGHGSGERTGEVLKPNTVQLIEFRLIVYSVSIPRIQ